MKNEKQNLFTLGNPSSFFTSVVLSQFFLTLLQSQMSTDYIFLSDSKKADLGPSRSEPCPHRHFIYIYIYIFMFD